MKLYHMVQLMEIAHIFRRQFGLDGISRCKIENLDDRAFQEFATRFVGMLRLLEQMEYDFEISLKHVRSGNEKSYRHAD